MIRARLPLLVLLATLAGCAGGRPPAPDPLPGAAPAGGAEEGLASWYGRPYHGRPTASGEKYDMHRMTAAHRTLPFGTRVEVTRLDTGRKVVVRINDRGPFVPGRILDLSRAAAEKLEMLRDGVVRVRIRVLTP